jgi:hypothetical protein
MKSRRFKRDLAIGTMLGACLWVAASAQTDPSDNPRGPGMQPALPPTGLALTPTQFEPPEQAFARLDTGRRGYLTRDQLAPLERFPFDAADTNGDGMLSGAEFARVWSQYNSKK